MKTTFQEKKVIINPRTRHNIIATTCQFSKNFKQTGIQQILFVLAFRRLFFFSNFLYFKWMIRGQKEKEEKHKTLNQFFCHRFLFLQYFVCFFLSKASTLSTSTLERFQWRHFVVSDNFESYVLHSIYIRLHLIIIIIKKGGGRAVGLRGVCLEEIFGHVETLVVKGSLHWIPIEKKKWY